jgi:hypothetical protein
LKINLNSQDECTEGGNVVLIQIIFSASKQEVGNPGSNLKKFVKKYKESYKVPIWNRQIGLNKDAVDYEKIKKANLFIVAAPKEQFTPT